MIAHSYVLQRLACVLTCLYLFSSPRPLYDVSSRLPVNTLGLRYDVSSTRFLPGLEMIVHDDFVSCHLWRKYPSLTFPVLFASISHLQQYLCTPGLSCSPVAVASDIHGRWKLSSLPYDLSGHGDVY